MKTLIISIALIATIAFKDPGKLTGRWQTAPSVKGNVTSVVFKSDKSFEGFVNKKPFVTGTYELTDSLFTLRDNGCNGVTAKYKIIFFSNEDSIRFQPIEDSCKGRLEGMNKMVLGRIK